MLDQIDDRLKDPDFSLNRDDFEVPNEQLPEIVGRGSGFEAAKKKAREHELRGEIWY